MDKTAHTRQEAEAQTLILPARYEDWGRFAARLDGYAIAEEMRLVEAMGLPQETGIGALSTWAWSQIRAFGETGQWPVETVLELRLLLFFKARQLHFCGEAEHDTFKVVHSLLKAISQRTGLPYADPQAEVRFAEEETLYAEKLRTSAEMPISRNRPPQTRTARLVRLVRRLAGFNDL
ncbi:MAG: hypothetical protein JXQ72_05490 [Anaerolineae bacterium]|nr:hypothetical protein [Anaerolineae bacterium]